MGDEAVQDFDDCDVVQDDDVAASSWQAPPARKARARSHPVVVVQGEQAVALAEVEARVSLPEEEVAENQRVVRASIDDPSFFVDHFVTEIIRLRPAVPVSWPYSVSQFKRVGKKAHPELFKERAVRMTKASFFDVTEPMASRILDGEWQLLSSVGVRNARAFMAASGHKLPPPTRGDFTAAFARRAAFGVGAWRTQKRQRLAGKEVQQRVK